jgi:hypothetical protein
MKRFLLLPVVFFYIGVVANAQESQRTTIKGNTEINVSTDNTIAVANGSNTVAKNRVGVIQGDKSGNTKISANATNVTTIASGRNKKACTNIGSVVSNECK